MAKSDKLALNSSIYNKLCDYINISEDNVVTIKNTIGDLGCRCDALSYRYRLNDYIKLVCSMGIDSLRYNNIKGSSALHASILLNKILEETGEFIGSKIAYRVLQVTLTVIGILVIIVPFLSVFGNDNILVYIESIKTPELLDEMIYLLILKIFMLMTLLYFSEKVGYCACTIAILTWNHIAIHNIIEFVDDYIEYINNDIEYKVEISDYDREEIILFKENLSKFSIVKGKLSIETELDREIMSCLDGLHSSLISLLNKVEAEPRRIYLVSSIFKLYLVEILKLLKQTSHMSEENLMQLKVTIINCQKYVDKAESEIYANIQNETSVSMTTLNSIFTEGEN